MQSKESLWSSNSQRNMSCTTTNTTSNLFTFPYLISKSERIKLKYVTIITYWLQAMAKLRILKCIQPKTQPKRIQYLLQNLLGLQILAALEQANVGFCSFLMR